jgi:hypothetical protein
MSRDVFLSVVLFVVFVIGSWRILYNFRGAE